MITIEFKDTSELIALAKAMDFVKYQCEDYDCKELSLSPFIGGFYDKILTKLEPYYQKRVPEFSKNNIFIEAHPQAINTIKSHIKNIDNWARLTEDLKLESLEAMIFPLRRNESTFKDLYDFANQFHSSITSD